VLAVKSTVNIITHTALNVNAISRIRIQKSIALTVNMVITSETSIMKDVANVRTVEITHVTLPMVRVWKVV